MVHSLSKRHKKFIATSVATSLAVTSIGFTGQGVASASTAKQTFTDLAHDHFAYEQVNDLVGQGIITGYEDGTFRPNESIRREHVALLFARTFNLQEEAYKGVFKDVPATNKYAKVIEAVQKQGIILGMTEQEFAPEKSVTREQMASLLVRAFELKTVEGQPVELTDLKTASPAHQKDIEILYQNEISTGYPDGSFRPKAAVSRAEFSVLLYKALMLNAQPEEEAEQQPNPEENEQQNQETPATNGNGGISDVPSIPSMPTEKPKNPFSNNETYAGPITITPEVGQVYGAETLGNEAIVNGNVELSGNISGSVTLQNVIIHGKLILNPGDNGSVTLSNVKADEIEILSGEKGTIHLNGVDTQSIIITDDNGLRIHTDGTSTIGHIEVAPENAAQSDIELEGNFNDATVTVTKGTKLTANENFAAKEIVINADEAVALASGTGDFANIEQVTVKKAVAIDASENSKIQTLNIDVDEQDRVVTLTGDLTEAEVVVTKPASLYIDATVNTIQANANVFIDGTPEKVASIQALQAAEGASVTPATEVMENLFEVIKNQMIVTAIEQIQKLPSAVTLKDIPTIENAIRLVNSARAFGAKKEEFIVGGVDYFAKLEAIQAKMANMMNHLVEVKKKLQALAINVETVQAIALESLQEKVAAAQAAIEAAQAAGVQQSDIEKVEHYAKLQEAVTRVEQLQQERKEALEKALEKMNALPAAETITFENFIATKAQLAEVQTAIAEAQAKGVTFEPNEAFEAVKAKIDQLEQEKQAAIQAANDKIAQIPAIETIHFTNIEAVRTTVAEANDLIAQARLKTASDDDFKTIAKVKEAETKIAALDEETRLAIQAANEAIASLVQAGTVDFTTLRAAEEKLAKALQAVTDAKAKNAKETDFIGLDGLKTIEQIIQQLVAQRTAAIEKAIAEIHQLPQAEAITYDNLEANRTVAKNARTFVADALAKSAYEKDITNLASLVKVEHKIVELDEAKRKAILAVNDALKDLPNAETLKYQEIAKLQEKLAELQRLLEDAYAKTAKDTDFVGLEKIDVLKARIQELEELKKAAIAEAVKAIELLPAAKEIRYTNLDEAQQKVDAAARAVKAAREAGATDSEIANIAVFNDVATLVEKMQAEKKQAIEAANTLLDALPALEEITYDNFNDMKAKLEAAKAAVEVAKEKGAKDADLPRLQYLNEFETYLLESVFARKVALDQVNELLAQLPSPTEVTVDNFEAIRIQLEQLDVLIQEAIRLGVTYNDFVGYENYKAVEAVVATFELNRDEAIEATKQLLAKIPKAADIGYTNLVEAQAAVEAAKAALEAAYAKGAEPADFDLTGLAQAELKIEQLTKEKVQAIANANAALAAVPLPTLINATNVADAQVKIDAAKKAVAAAKEKTAVDSDFVGLEKIAAAQQKVDEILTARKVAIETAILAIKKLPAIDKITAENANEVRLLANEAQQAVQQALTLGATRADITGIEHLNAVFVKLEQFGISLEEAIANANKALETLLSIGEVTSRNALEIYAQYLNVYMHVEIAKRAGATAADFNSEAYAIYESLLETLQPLLPKRPTYADPLEALAFINDNLDTFTLHHLQNATSRYVEESRLESYRAELKKLRSEKGEALTISDLIAVMNIVDDRIVAAIVEKINTDIDNVTKEEIDEISWIFDEVYEQVIAQLKQMLQASTLTESSIRSIAQTINRSYAMVYVNANPTSFDMQHLSWATSDDRYVKLNYTLLNKYREAIANKKATDSSLLVTEQIIQIVTDVNTVASNEVLAKINNDIASVTQEEISILLNMESWAFAPLLKELIELKITKQRPLTLADVEQALQNVYNVELLQVIIDNPTSFDIQALYNLRLSDIREEYLEQYRAAVVEALKEGKLTIALLQTIITNVNKNIVQTTVQAINDNAAGFTYAMLRIVASDAKEQYMPQYRQAIVDARQAGKRLSQSDIQAIVRDVHAQFALVRINANPHEVNIDDLIVVTNEYIESSTFTYYQQAISARYNETNKPFTKEELIALVREVKQNVQAQIVADIAENPERITMQLLNAISIYMEAKYLEAYIEAVKQWLQTSEQSLTIEILQQIRWDVEQVVGIRVVNENPTTFTVDDFRRATNYGIEDYYLPYLQAAISKAITLKGAYLTKQEMLAVLEELRITLPNIAVAEINANPLEVSFEFLQMVHYYVEQQYLTDYRQALYEAIQENGELTSYEIANVLKQVTNDKYIEQLNKDRAAFDMNKLNQVVSYSLEWSLEAQYFEAIVNDPKYGSLTAEDLIRIVKEVNLKAVLELINTAPETIEEHHLWNLANDFNISFKYQYFEQYKQAIIKRVKEQNEPFTSAQQLADFIDALTEAFLLEAINKNLDAVAHDLLRSLFEADYENVYDFVKWEYLEYYRAAFVEEQQKTNADLSKATIEAIITRINEEQHNKRLQELAKPILENPTDFSYYDLGNLVGHDNLLGYYTTSERYLEVIGTKIVSGEIQTPEQIIQAVLALNEQIIAEYIAKIMRNDHSITLDELRDVYNYQKPYSPDLFEQIFYNNFKQYLEAFSQAIAAGKQLTVADIRAIVYDVNVNVQAADLQKIIQNPADFTLDDLYRLSIYEVFEVNLTYYRDAVVTYVNSHSTITVEALNKLIKEANTRAKSDAYEAIKNDPLNATAVQLQRLTSNHGTYIDSYYRLASYQVALYYNLISNAQLTIDQLVAIIEEINNLYNYDYPTVKYYSEYDRENELIFDKGYNTMFYVIPKTAAKLYMTEQELEELVANGQGYKLEEYLNRYTIALDTSLLQAGEYVAYVVSMDSYKVSLPSKSFKVTTSPTEDADSSDAAVETLKLTESEAVTEDVPTIDVEESDAAVGEEIVEEASPVIEVEEEQVEEATTIDAALVQDNE